MWTLIFRVMWGALTAALVDVPSVSGDEKELADAIEGVLAWVPPDGAAGRERRRRVDPPGPAGAGDLAGHLDTVPIAGNVPSHTEGDLLYGCGSCDMKSGVAVQLRLAYQLPSPSRDVTYVFDHCEEIEAERNRLLRLSRNAPEVAPGGSGGPAGADRWRYRGRLPGNDAGRGHRAGGPRAQRALLAWA